MSGALALLLGVSASLLNTVITVGNSGSFFGFLISTFGSLSRATFTDRSGVSRTVNALEWDRTASGAVILYLATTGITNSDATFVAIVVNGVTLARSAATYSSNDGSGNGTKWQWATDTSAYPNTGTTLAVIK